jgi:hypothetical protein
VQPGSAYRALNIVGSSINLNNGTAGIGSVGIGVTSPAYSLDVSGTFNVSAQAYISRTSAGKKLVLWDNGSINGNLYDGFCINSGVLGYNVNSSDNHVFYKSSTDGTSQIELMRIVGSTGYVGIGKSSPTRSLDISNGSIGLSSTTGAAANFIYFTATSKTSYWLQQYDIGANDFLTLTRQGGNDLCIKGSNGYVGINTSIPAYVFDVSGTTRINNKLIMGSSYDGTSSTISDSVFISNSLCIVGQNSGSGSRYVNLWDNVNVTVQLSVGYYVNNTSSYKLDVNGTGIIRGTLTVQNVIDASTDLTLRSGSGSYTYFDGGGTHRMILTSTGLGVGNVVPSYPLHIVGNATSPSATYHYLNGTDVNFFSSVAAVAIYAQQGWIWSEYGFMASSDRRIKKNILDINDISALDTIRIIKPRRYEYIDTKRKGTTPVWGFIAQELKEVIDYCVSTQTETIPNIYDIADICFNILTLRTKSTSLFEFMDPSGNTYCDTSGNLKIKLYDASDNPIQTQLTEIIDPSSFKISTDLDISCCFVYGQEINDFHTVDKNAIFTVGISALQEVDTELQALKTTVADLTTTVTDLTTTVTDLTTALNNQQAVIDTLIARITALGG